MPSTEKNASVDDSNSKGKRDRSPNYPAIGLAAALEHAAKIYEKEKRSEVSSEIAAKHLGYTSMNGRARRVLSALKAYGLFSEQAGQLRITEQGLHVMVYKEGAPERQAALREMAMRPQIFQTLMAKFGEHVPSDENFKAKLITEYGFMEDGAEACVRAFKESLPFAKLAAVGQETPLAAPASAPTLRNDQGGDSFGPPSAPEKVEEPTPGAKWRTVFPVGKNVTVEIVASGPLKAKQYDLLIKHVNLLKEAAMADEAGESEEAT
jgi:hypothetical protein